jgi:dihydroxyacetone kinase-like protein
MGVIEVAGSTVVDSSVCVDWLARFQVAVEANSAYLTELDSAIGDADHGANMARGMAAVMQTLSGSEPGPLDTLLRSVGMTLVSSVGGASGPLYGTFFLKAAGVSGPGPLEGAALAVALHAGLEGIVARGRAEPGDKTLVDAMGPALDALDTALASGSALSSAADSAAHAAESGRDSTEPMLARKGRASYLGERSVGHIDPGATSTALLFRALADALSAASTAAAEI